MILKPGDKVSFLNEKRDGIVKKILNNKMVLVEIEDGFDIPVLEHDLVKAEAFDKIEIDNKKTTAIIKEEETSDERFPERTNLYEVNDETDKKTKHGIYLAFIPENPDNVLASSFGIYLVNHNSHDILFTFSLKEQEKFICKDFDRLDEEAAVLLDIIDKSDLEKWKDIQFQFLFFKKGFNINKAPVVCDIQVKPVRFYKEDNYSFYAFIDEKCFLISLSDKEKPQPEQWTDDKWENTKMEKPSGIKIVGHINEIIKTIPFPEKHILEKGVAEVDLHIEELTENYSQKESFDLLNIQLDYFSKMLELAIDNRFRKIIFIHGVGNGKLRQEIINKLTNNYPDLKFADASFFKYGKGATEIILKEIGF